MASDSLPAQGRKQRHVELCNAVYRRSNTHYYNPLSSHTNSRITVWAPRLVKVLRHQEDRCTIGRQLALSGVKAVEPEELRLIVVNPVASQPTAEAVVIHTIVGIGSVASVVKPERALSGLIEIESADRVGIRKASVDIDWREDCESHVSSVDSGLRDDGNNSKSILPE